MLTVLAWTAFVPALVWNATIVSIAFSDRSVNWMRKDNLIHLAISLAVLFVPGVYLFGWF